MHLFGKEKSNTFDNPRWHKAYRAVPKIYVTEEEMPFGAFALNEETPSIFPKRPRANVDGVNISDWKLYLVSMTNDELLGDVNYFKALDAMKEYTVDEDSENILIRAINLGELEALLHKCR
jgi:hypothetical protein